MSDAEPDGYETPAIAWLVEYADPREPGVSFQAGAFTSQAEAERLLAELEAAGGYTDLRINMVAVHQRVEDWEWDR